MKRVVMIRSNPIRPYPRLEKMANAIRKMGNEVLVLAWDRVANYPPKKETLTLKDSKVRIIRVGIKGEFSGGFKKNAVGLIKFERFLYFWLKKHREEYDIIHAYDFDCGYVAAKISKKYGKKLVYDIADYYVDSHNLKGSFIGNIIERKEIAVINGADVTIICSEKRKKQICASKPKRLVVIHNTPDISMEFDVEEKVIQSSSEKYKLVYVGVLGRNRFIDKIAEVVGEREDCEFHIGGFGGGLEPLFEAYASKYKNVFFYGRIPYEQTIALEKECDALCAIYDPSVPNHVYAAPNKFYEALALGKPLLMARGTGMSEVVQEYGLGVVMDYSKEALSEAISSLIKTRDKASEIGQRAKELYVRQYSWTEMEKRINSLYLEL